MCFRFIRNLKIIILGIVISLPCQSFAEKQSINNMQNEIEPGIYIFVSFSMNDQSLRDYFDQANNIGARLIIRGLLGKHGGVDRFSDTKARIEEARINVDINPVLFKRFEIKQVPVIVVAKKDGAIKKISGHISLNKALEIMHEDVGSS